MYGVAINFATSIEMYKECAIDSRNSNKFKMVVIYKAQHFFTISFRYLPSFLDAAQLHALIKPL